MYINKYMQLFVVVYCHYSTIHPQSLKSTLNHVDFLGTLFHLEEIFNSQGANALFQLIVTMM